MPESGISVIQKACSIRVILWGLILLRSRRSVPISYASHNRLYFCLDLHFYEGLAVLFDY